MRIIFRHRKILVPKAPKLKIKNQLKEYSNEMEDVLEYLEEMIGKPDLPETTRNLFQALLRSSMILKENEIDKETIERISWYQKMLLDTEDFSVWLSYWMEDQLALIKTTKESLEETL